MKKLFYFLFLSALAFSPSIKAQKSSGDDQAALRKVIENETRSYFEGNYDKWAATWSHNADCLVLFITPTGSTQLTGWDKVSESFKTDMKAMKPIDEDNFAVYYKKYDYNYKIDGNLAVVSFKEGRGNEGTRVMEKQNGSWKIKNLMSTSSPAYNMATTYNSLKSFAGRWEINNSSYKSSQQEWKILSGLLEIRETVYGIELNSESTGSASGVTYMNSEREQFIKDNSRDELRYFDIYKTSTGYSSTNNGSASTDTSGNIVVTVMDHDNNNVVSFDNVYSSKSADILHLDGHAYDKKGKITNTWSFDLKRL